MPFELEGAGALLSDLQKLAAALDSEDDTNAVDRALKSGAVMIHSRMIQNASSDPKIITGELVGSIRTSGVKKRDGGKRITIGVHHQDGAAYYSAPLEYGHGGPGPAPAHPFVRPAFDAESDAAFALMRQELSAALDRRS